VHDREDSGTTVVVALDGLVIFEQSADLGRLRQHAARNIGGDKGVDLALLQHLAEVGSIHDAEVDAHKAIALAPDLSEGHLALASVYKSLLDFKRADEEYDRALKLDPGNTRILRRYGWFASLLGREGLPLLQRAAALDHITPIPISLSVVGCTFCGAMRRPLAYKDGAALSSGESGLTLGLAGFESTVASPPSDDLQHGEDMRTVLSVTAETGRGF